MDAIENNVFGATPARVVDAYLFWSKFKQEKGAIVGLIHMAQFVSAQRDVNIYLRCCQLNPRI